MRTRIVIAATTLGWGALIACGGAEDTAQRFPVADDFDTAIEQLATAHCERWQACDPLDLALYYVDQDSCRATLTGFQREAVKLSGATFVPADLSRYANDLSQGNCAWFEQHASLLPRKPGSHVDGERCLSSFQCQSLNCRYVDGADCGVCAQVPQLGATCYWEDCGEGNICSGSSLDAGVCVRLGLLGDPCDGPHLCARGLACLSGICSQGQGAGASCNDRIPCASGQNLYCGPDGTCRPIGASKLGEACGTLDGEVLQCVYSTSRCLRSDGSVTGTCVARTPLGGSCDLDAGPWCEVSLACIDGICATPDTSSCQ